MDLNGEHRLLIDRVKAGNEQALNFCQCRSVAGVSSNLGCQYGCNFLHHTKGVLSVGKYPLHFPRNFDSSCYILNDCEDPSSVRSMPGTPKRIMPSTTGRISKWRRQITGRAPAPELVVTDYELTPLQDMSREFPGPRSLGCNYHSGNVYLSHYKR
jgi:hypothetical protein